MKIRSRCKVYMGHVPILVMVSGILSIEISFSDYCSLRWFPLALSMLQMNHTKDFRQPKQNLVSNFPSISSEKIWENLRRHSYGTAASGNHNIDIPKRSMFTSKKSLYIKRWCTALLNSQLWLEIDNQSIVLERTMMFEVRSFFCGLKFGFGQTKQIRQHQQCIKLKKNKPIGNDTK